MKSKVTLTSFLILCFSSLSWSLDITPEGLYSSTIEACNEIKTHKLGSIYEDRWNTGYFNSQSYTQLLNLIMKHGRNNLLSDLNPKSENSILNFVLNEPLFHKALVDCAPDDIKIRDYLISSIHKADLRGKVVALVALVVIFRGVGVAQGAIAKWIVGANIWIMRTSQFLNISFLTSLIRSSSEQRIEVQTPIKIDPISKDEIQVRQKKNVDDLLSDLKVVQNKLKECNGCSDRQILEIYQNTLQQSLAITQR